MNVVFIHSPMDVESLKAECVRLIEKNSVIGFNLKAYDEEDLKYIVDKLGDDIDSVCICPEETFMSSEDFLKTYKKEKDDDRLYLLSTVKFIR